MKKLHILLVIVAVLAFVVYPVSLVVTDTTPAQFEESADDIETYWGDNPPWYTVGVIPALLTSAALTGVVALVAWLNPIQR